MFGQDAPGAGSVKILEGLAQSSSERTFLTEASIKYERAITPAVAQYLLGRGIDREAATAARLGLVAEPEPGHDSYRGRLSIPYLTPAGVVGFRFRALDSSDLKYLGVAGQPTRLYNAGVLHKSPDMVAICEGELDAVVMQYRVGVPAVAVPGGNNWKTHYPLCFADVDKVFVVMDSDSAGEGFAHRILRDLPEAKIVRPPNGMDVTDWFLAEGSGAIRERLGV